jgi:HPt (histidine-containing phosphotransfer) domain-containing protein
MSAHDDQEDAGVSPMFTASELLARMMGDAAFCREILALGLRDAREHARVVSALGTGGQLDTTRRALHALRGSAALFGAASFVALLGQMENDCEDRREDVVLAALDRFGNEHARYVKGLLALADEMEHLP